LTTAANAAGCRTTAVITDMNQPLAPALGNALEVAEVMKALTGETEGPLVQLSAALGGVLLADAGLAEDVQAGADSIAACIRDGRAAARFGRMVAALGGPVAFLDDWRRFLPEANVIREVTAPMAGHVTSIDGEALGLAVVNLGGGRHVESDVVDPSVGLSGLVRLGQQVERGQPIAVVHAAREDAALAAERVLLDSISLDSVPGAVPDLIHERID
jgi:thymidine phosphorylase